MLLLDIKGEHTLYILLYRALGSIHNFVINFMEHLEDIFPLASTARLLLLCDFNLDQEQRENVNRMYPSSQRFNLHQRSHYQTHVH